MAGRGAAAEDLWRFSLMVYAKPDVADALICLQDRGGHNVNLMLYGLWLGLCMGLRLDSAALTRGKSAMERLDRDVVMPLRSLRRALKDDSDPDIRALRRRVLALEIAAERRVLARLAASVALRGEPAEGEGHTLAEANLTLILGTDSASEEADLLRRVIADL